MAFFEHIEGLVSSKLGILHTALSMMKLEARLAGLSVFPLVLNVCFLLVVLVTIWLSAMLLLGYFTTVAFGNKLLGLLLVLFFNIVVFFLLLNYLTFNLKKMSFEKTRKYFSTHKEKQDASLEKATDSSN